MVPIWLSDCHFSRSNRLNVSAVYRRATPVNDFFAKNGKIRIDGRMVHDMYLFEVKKPEESKGEWDLYKLIATVPGDEAFRPLDKGGCPLVKG